MDFLHTDENLLVSRPKWAEKNAEMRDYYDHHWGFPIHDDRQLFELLTLEVFQAGLPWQMVWHKREGFRKAFCNFELAKVVDFSAFDILRLINDKAIIRNRRKIGAVMKNAHVIDEIRQEGLTFDHYLWQTVNFKPLRVQPDSTGRLDRTSPEAEALAKKMTNDGFHRIGPVTAFSFMCAIGMVNDRIDGRSTPVHQEHAQ